MTNRAMMAKRTMVDVCEYTAGIFRDVVRQEGVRERPAVKRPKKENAKPKKPPMHGKKGERRV